jgi:hypothetical protein
MKRRKQKGHAILELALSAGVMTACLVGTLQFGYTFYIYNQLVTAVGNGARFASLKPMSGDAEADKAAIRNLVVASTLAAARLQPEQVEVEVAADTVRVAIRSYRIDALVTKIDFDGRPAVEFPYIGSAQ